MRKYLALFLVPLVLISCDKKQADDSGREVVISASLETSKVTLDSGRQHYQWETSDNIGVFCNSGSGNVSATVAEGSAVVNLPLSASEVYVLYPYVATASEGPSKVPVTVPAEQTQAEAGKLPGRYVGFSGKASIVSDEASVTLHPLAATLALNIYDSSLSSEEKVQSIVLTPKQNASFAGSAELDLTDGNVSYTAGQNSVSAITLFPSAPVDVAASKPAAPKTYENQLYISLAHQSYRELQFDIVTDKRLVRVTSPAETAIDLTSCDIITLTIDLSDGRMLVSGGTEDFEVISKLETGLASFSPLKNRDPENLTDDVIPDFSRVGYKYGDVEIPTVPVKRTLTVEDVWNNTVSGGGTYADSTAYIQAVIDEVASEGGGAILFKEGTYNVSRTLFLDSDNLVLRGEGTDKTKLYGLGTKGWSLVYIGKSLATTSATTDVVWSGRALSLKTLKAAGDGAEFGNYYVTSYTPRTTSISHGGGTAVTEDYVPVGRLYVEVKDASGFSVGEHIAVCRPFSLDWVSDIGMDKIASNGPKRTTQYNAGVQQWSSRSGSFVKYMRRKVAGIVGNRIYLDAPIIFSLDVAYGGGMVYHESCQYVTGCGVEYLTIDSEFDSSKTMTLTASVTKQKYTSYKDEHHTWKAVEIKSAEHCWVRNVDCWHMGYSLACLTTGAKNISVLNCNSHEPASYLSGGRRYAFCLEGSATMNLFKNCTVDMERHGFISNVGIGPNAYVYCSGTKMCDGPEPHQSFCLADLYDNMNVPDTHIYVRDRGNSGTGHGWAGGNYVFWNCTAGKLECQNVWSRENSPQIETMASGYQFHSDHASAHNWCIGCVGTKSIASYNYKSPYFSTDPLQEDYYIDVLGIEHRPDGYWYPEREVGSNGSASDRINLAAVPADAAAKSWWPQFPAGLTSYSDPWSLYECQLEDRHARGIFLNTL